MKDRIPDFAGSLREGIAETIADRRRGLVEDISLALSALGEDFGAADTEWHVCAGQILDAMTSAVRAGDIDSRGVQDLFRVVPRLTTRQMVRMIHRAERCVLDELALNDEIGATSEHWASVAHATRTAAYELVAALADRGSGDSTVRDPLTTLITRQVFDLALEQETHRALRHNHGMAVILFDLDNLSNINAQHGHRAGDRLLERMGILARQFFRTHDWVTRYSEDAVGALLPETRLDQAITVANKFREMVAQRFVLTDHRTDASTTVTVSGAVVGTDLVQEDIAAKDIMAEAEAAVVRAKMNGGNQIESVAIMPTSVTILGAATLLGTGAHEVTQLIRAGTLRASRRGRHYHIDRAHIDEFKRARES